MKKLPNKITIANAAVDKYTEEAICQSVDEFLRTKFGATPTYYSYDIHIDVADIEGDDEEEDE